MKGECLKPFTGKWGTIPCGIQRFGPTNLEMLQDERGEMAASGEIVGMWYRPDWEGTRDQYSEFNQ